MTAQKPHDTSIGEAEQAECDADFRRVADQAVAVDLRPRRVVAQQTSEPMDHADRQRRTTEPNIHNGGEATATGCRQSKLSEQNRPSCERQQYQHYRPVPDQGEYVEILWI